MASGYGLNGGSSRCYPFWQEVLACYHVNTTAHDVSGAKKCVLQLEDYLECLHHTKERKRAMMIQDAYRKRLADKPPPAEDILTARQVRGLGLLKGTPEEKNLSTFGGWIVPKDPSEG